MGYLLHSFHGCGRLFINLNDADCLFSECPFECHKFMMIFQIALGIVTVRLIPTPQNLGIKPKSIAIIIAYLSNYANEISRRVCAANNFYYSLSK